MRIDRFEQRRTFKRGDGCRLVWKRRKQIYLSYLEIDSSSDLYLHNPELFRNAAQKHLEIIEIDTRDLYSMFQGKQPKQIEAFLREYRGIELTLLHIAVCEDIAFTWRYEFGWTSC